MGFRRDGLKACLLQPPINGVTDVVAVIGLVEHAAKVFHRRTELGGIGQLHRVGQGENPTWFQQAETLVEHVLARLAREFVQQKHTAHGLEAAIGKGHRFAIALHQLG